MKKIILLTFILIPTNLIAEDLLKIGEDIFYNKEACINCHILNAADGGQNNLSKEHVINIVETYKKMFQPDKTYSFGHSLGGGCTVHALLNYGSSNNKRNSTLLFDKVLLFALKTVIIFSYESTIP